VEPRGWVFLILLASYSLLSRSPRFRLLLDPWLSRRQKRILRELLRRLPLDTAAFISWMVVATDDAAVVEAVRQRVAEGVEYLIGSQVSLELLYPHDRIVIDLGIGAGPDLLDTAVIVALEKDLGITIPDRDAELVNTLEDLVHLCARRRALGNSALERGR
jgi:hypothetical protein